METEQIPLVEMVGVSVDIFGQSLLKNIDLKVFPNQITTLIGPNGAGKTTLIKALVGLIKISSGRIQYHHPLKIGYVPQKLFLDSSLPLTVNRFLSASKHFHHQDLSACLQRVEGLQLINKKMSGLSGGELQRVLIARALMGEPELLVLDEPVQGVDVKGQAVLYNLIRDIQVDKQVSVLMVSHDLHIVMAHTDEVICLNQHICCKGHPSSVQASPEFIELFGLPDNSPFAIYTHRHDHSHQLDGTIEPSTPS